MHPAPASSPHCSTVLDLPQKPAPSVPAHVGVRVRVAGHDFDLLPSRAAYWHTTRTLLVADLHLGKAETFQRAGVPMPSAAMHESLDRLSQLIAQTSAQRVLVLGDLLHAPIGITPSMIDTVADWRRRVDIHLHVVSGNHDRHIDLIADAWNLKLLGHSHHEHNLHFVHDPASLAAFNSPAFAWAGHIHPAITLGHTRARVKLPCFVLTDRLALLPAFSCFTSGTSIGTPPKARVFACADAEVIEVGRRPGA